MEKNNHICFILHLKSSFIYCTLFTFFVITATIFSSYSAQWSPEDAKRFNHNQPISTWLLDFLGEENNLPTELPVESANIVFDDDSVPLSNCLPGKIHTINYGLHKQYLLFNKSLASLFKPELSTPPPKSREQIKT
jgi:hypothetical protein